jgi:two-component system, response regulator PdtaR
MRRYLIVDDNRPLAENLAEIIRDRGDEAAVATSGAEALILLAAERFDAILTDMRMPAMDGAELIREARRTDPGLPAIVVTAFSKDAGIRAAQNEGPLAVLPKPVPVPQLLHLLDVARRNGRVLLVEDDPVLCDNLAEALQERGFSVAQFGSIDALEALPSDPPLLAIVDLRVPGAPDGSAFRAVAERFPGLPILVVTAYREASVPVEPDRLFLKPFDTGRLLGEVESLHKTSTRS